MAVTTMSFSNSLFLLMLVCIILMNRHEGCLEEEREGLLQFRAFLKSNVASDSDNLLPTWIGEGCCEWERVKCENTTGHVIELSLNSIEQLSSGYFKSWVLDVSLFLPFKNIRTLNLSYNNLPLWLDNRQGSEGLSSLRKLEILDLSGNYFDDKVNIFGALGAITSLKTLILKECSLEGYFPAHELVALEYLEKLDISVNRYNGSLPLQGFERLSVLKKMEILNLDSNSFSNGILPSLGALKSLKVLYLGSNAFSGSFPTQELKNLSNLEVLLLDNNHFNSTQSMQGLASFRRLEILNLSSNKFVGSIPSSIGTLSSLRELSFAGNELNSIPPLQGLCELKKLEELDLGYNIFEGVIPPCLSSLTSLRFFDLSGNRFTGNLSSSLVANLTSLEYIDLSENCLEGLFSFSCFANHAKLEVVLFSGNNKLELETESSDWVPMFQLKVLSLSNCNLNRFFGGDVPNFLVHQRELRLLDLSHNSLQGTFPNWLLKNNTKLEAINLNNNSFRGPFHLMPHQNAKTSLVDVSGNHLHGRIQSNISQILPNLYHLNLSRNAFSGVLPFSICNITELMLLDLSINSFSEEVPRRMFTDCHSLKVLKLSDNKFRGQILETNFTSGQLNILNLENNKFMGELPKMFPEGLAFLEMVDISNNLFSGVIPSWISNLSCLTSLSMQNNSFEGQFPGEFSVDLQFLDISHNKLSGSLPVLSNNYFDSMLNMGSRSLNLEHLHLESNRFTGPVPSSYRNLSSLLVLDMSENNLSGTIPDFLGELSNLRILLLRRNDFSGWIPRQLCQLSDISMIDLSSNSLVGSIPHCLRNIAPPYHFGFIQEANLGFGGGIDYKYSNHLRRSFQLSDSDYMYEKVAQVDFVTKHMSGTYKGTLLNLMSGLDLSCNNLTGEIPQELGLLNQILVLNLSHNQLTGTIPRLFSNLTQLESLDLSFNSLSGEIPSDLIKLNYLEVFVVAQNNLSGRIPEMKEQFSTFEKDAYEGNRFLCGPPLEKTCTSPAHSPTSSDEIQEKWYDIDLDSFCASLAATSTVVFLGSVGILYINPNWRRRWFHFIEECIFACYYFLPDSIHKMLSLFK